MQERMNHEHTFTEIAPELSAEGEEHYAHLYMWEWCTLCGTLKLGTLIFEPGIHQKPILIAATDPCGTTED